MTEIVARHAGLPFKNIDPLKLDPDVVTQILSRAFARRTLSVPVERTEDHLTLGVVDPYHTEAIENVERMGYKVHRVMAPKTDVLKIIPEFYGFRSSVTAAAREMGPGVDLGNLEQFVKMKSVSEIEATDRHVVNAVEFLFRYAFDQRASDIHIGPFTYGRYWLWQSTKPFSSSCVIESMAFRSFLWSRTGQLLKFPMKGLVHFDEGFHLVGLLAELHRAVMHALVGFFHRSVHGFKGAMNPLAVAEGYGRDDFPERGIQAAWFRIVLDSRVAQAPVIRLPGFFESQRLFTHDRFIRQKAQQTDLGLSRENEAHFFGQHAQPIPGFGTVRVTRNGKSKPVFDPTTRARRPVGDVFAVYTHALPPEADLQAVRLTADPLGAIDVAKPQTVTLHAQVANAGNISVTRPFTVEFYAGYPLSGTLIAARTVTMPLAGCGAAVEIRVRWPALITGVHPAYIRVVSPAGLSETDLANNVRAAQILVAPPRVYLPMLFKAIP